MAFRCIPAIDSRISEHQYYNIIQKYQTTVFIKEAKNDSINIAHPLEGQSLKIPQILNVHNLITSYVAPMGLIRSLGFKKICHEPHKIDFLFRFVEVVMLFKQWKQVILPSSPATLLQ